MVGPFWIYEDSLQVCDVHGFLCFRIWIVPVESLNCRNRSNVWQNIKLLKFTHCLVSVINVGFFFFLLFNLFKVFLAKKEWNLWLFLLFLLNRFPFLFFCSFFFLLLFDPRHNNLKDWFLLVKNAWFQRIIAPQSHFVFLVSQTKLLSKKERISFFVLKVASKIILLFNWSCRRLFSRLSFIGKSRCLGCVDLSYLFFFSFRIFKIAIVCIWGLLLNKFSIGRSFPQNFAFSRICSLHFQVFLFI